MSTSAPAVADSAEVGDPSHRNLQQSRPRAFGHWIQVVVLATPVLMLAILAWHYRNVFEDGYIYLHVVQNIIAGNGPVFNQGQRVEVFTGPLWTFIVATVGFLTPFSLEWIAVLLGILMTLGGVTMAILGAVWLSRVALPKAFLLPLGALVFASTYPIWTLASTGLETGLTYFWLGLCFFLIVRWSINHRMGRMVMIVLGLGPLVRPELLIDSAVFVLAIMAVERPAWSWRQNVRLIAWAALLPVLYQFFRMGYYGEFVATTAIAKEATLPDPGRGLAYFEDFVRPYWLWIPAIALGAGAYYPLSVALRRADGSIHKQVALFALPVAGVLNAAYITLMGGDYFHARLLTPAFFALCAPVAAVPVSRRFVVSLIVLPWSAVACFTMRTPSGDTLSSHLTGPPTQYTFVFTPGNGQITPGFSENPHSLVSIRWFQQHGLYVNLGFFPSQTQRIDEELNPRIPDPTIVASGIGEVSFHFGTGVNIFDILGLADPLTGHMKLSHRGPAAGHEKPLPTPWIIAAVTASGSSTSPIANLQPERHLFITPDLFPEATGRQLNVQTAWARAALQCPAIHNLEYGQNGPLTVRRFFRNIWDAWGNSQLRIPPNPETAFHQFCGPGTPEVVKETAGLP